MPRFRMPRQRITAKPRVTITFKDRGIPNVSLPYSIDFGGAIAGALPAGWIGSTWAVSGGGAVNTPVQGASVVVNGSFDVNVDGWTAVNSTLQSVAGGQPTNNLLITNTIAAIGRARQAMTTVIGTWYLLDMYQKNGTSTMQLIAGSTAGGLDTVPANYYNSFGSATWLRMFASFMAISTTTWFDFYVNNTGIGNNTNIDELAIRPVSGLLCLRDAKAYNLNITGTYGTLTTRTFVGVASNVSSDGSAGIVAMRSEKHVELWKWIGTTWTRLVSVVLGPTANKLPQIVTEKVGSNLIVDLYYNSVLIDSVVVGDSQIVNNTYIGLFATY